MTEENKYDGLFMTIMQQTKDINVFFDAVFGFLRYSVYIIFKTKHRLF